MWGCVVREGINLLGVRERWEGRGGGVGGLGWVYGFCEMWSGECWWVYGVGGGYVIVVLGVGGWLFFGLGGRVICMVGVGRGREFDW